jgi:hypothetical protein
MSVIFIQKNIVSFQSFSEKILYRFSDFTENHLYFFYKKQGEKQRIFL